MSRTIVSNVEPEHPGDDGGGIGSGDGSGAGYEGDGGDDGGYEEPGGYTKPDGSTGYSGDQSGNDPVDPLWADPSPEASAGAALTIACLTAEVVADIAALSLFSAATAKIVGVVTMTGSVTLEVGHAITEAGDGGSGGKSDSNSKGK